jgi:hypothetical protein
MGNNHSAFYSFIATGQATTNSDTSTATTSTSPGTATTSTSPGIGTATTSTNSDTSTATTSTSPGIGTATTSTNSDTSTATTSTSPGIGTATTSTSSELKAIDDVDKAKVVAQALADAAAKLLAEQEALAFLAKKFAGNDQALSNFRVFGKVHNFLSNDRSGQF